MAFAGVVAYGLITGTTQTFGWSVPFAKIVVESGLFIASFLINRDFIFASRSKAEEQRS